MDELAKPRVTAAAPTPVRETVSQPAAKSADEIKTDNYLMYTLDHDIPFLADHFGVENMLAYKDLSYKAEIDSIDSFLVDEVKSKRLDNTTEAVTKRLAQLEKIAGIDKLAPVSVRTQQLAAFVGYIQKLNSINRDPLQL